MPRRQSLPGEYRRQSVVNAPVADDISISFTTKDRFMRGLLDKRYDTQYIVETERLDGVWTLSIKWIGRESRGVEVVLPDEVVSTIMRQHDSIIKSSRKDAGHRSAETRKRKLIEEAGEITENAGNS